MNITKYRKNLEKYYANIVKVVEWLEPIGLLRLLGNLITEI